MSKRLRRKERAKKAAMIGIPVVGIFAGLGKIFSRRKKKKRAALSSAIAESINR
jgi:hypothetical protein